MTAPTSRRSQFTGVGRDRSFFGTTLGATVVVIVVGLVVPLLVAANAGALGVPRSDDWSYLVTLFRWSDGGGVHFNHWVSMTLLGQLAAARPVVAIFGTSVYAVQVWSAVVGVVGLLCLFALGRRVRLRTGASLFVACTIAVGPLWGQLSTTFMTDVPAFTAQMAALLCATRGVARGARLRWLVAALAFGVVGFSIRQYAAVPLAAIIFVGVATTWNDRALRRRFLGLSSAAIVACVAILWTWAQVPDPLTVTPKFPTGGSISTATVGLAGLLRLCGLLLLPIILWVGPRRIVGRAFRQFRRPSILVTLGTAAWLTVAYFRSPRLPFVGNYLDRLGTLGNDVAAGHRPDVIPGWLYDGLVVVASVGAIVLVLAIVPAIADPVGRWRGREWAIRDPARALLALTIAGFAAAYSVAMLVGLPMFDRYVLPAVPLIGLLLMTQCPATEPAGAAAQPARLRRRRWIAAMALVGIATLGLAYTAESASFDARRWRVAEAATRAGYRPLQVYGGFEWLGWHRRVGPPRSEDPIVRQRERVEYFRHLCVFVVVNPIPRALRKSLAHDTVEGVFHSYPIAAVRVDEPC